MNKTAIEYLDYTWNPLAMRCTPLSEGCANCWHLKFAKRHAGNKRFSDDCLIAYLGGPPHLKEDELRAPLKLKKPSRIGVQFMGDLFHEAITDDQIANVFWIMQKTRTNQTYYVLTKRVERMLHFIKEIWFKERNYTQGHLSNVLLGASIENQEQADKRIPILLQIPAAVRFVSVEPMLGPVDLELQERWCTYEDTEYHYDCETKADHLHWVICGGESGPGARHMELPWVRNIRNQCIEANVPFFFKQWGEFTPYVPYGNYIGMMRVGKKAAGRVLDGQVWNQMP